MHIGLLTLPLNTNYGGILQAYALSTHLQTRGHSVRLITRRKDHGSLPRNTLVRLKWLCLPLLARLRVALPLRLLAVERFKQRYLRYLTPPVFTTAGLVELCKAENFNIIIVGSDQIWNRTAAPDLFNCYLDFCEQLPAVSRATYACSFAKDDWDYTEEQTSHCMALLAKFRAISVREENACAFIAEKFGRKALLHVDPTLLFDGDHYRKLADPILDTGYCFSYILDNSPQKAKVLQLVCSALGLRSRSIQDPLYAGGAVETWLGLHANSAFVLTDSYHGMLFAIIFRKPFLVIRNQQRGGARFNSILERLDLMNRMVDLERPDVDAVLKKSIDWDAVDMKLKPWIEESRAYIDWITVEQ